MSLEIADSWPYDGPDDQFTEADASKDWSVRAARGVIENLMDRRGIKNGFYGVDHDVRVEIVQTLAGIIRMAHKEQETSP